jgi:hypothetical protein
MLTDKLPLQRVSLLRARQRYLKGLEQIERRIQRPLAENRSRGVTPRHL